MLCNFFKWARFTTPLVSMLAIGACATSEAPAPQTFAVYYGHEASRADLQQFDLLVFQPEHEALLERLDPQQIALAYVSIGEAAHGSLSEAQQSLIIRAHTYWPSDLIDVRDPRWQHHIVTQVVAPALQDGFDGVMLDTADSPLHLEATEPQHFSGMTQATKRLIQRIRQAHPDSHIMLNRGISIWPDIAGDVDSVLVESILSNYDLSARHAELTAPELYQQHLDKISAIKRLNPSLKVYSLDYWDMNDTGGVRHLYRVHRRYDLIPYVSTPELNRLYPEPAVQQNPAQRVEYPKGADRA